MASPSVRDFPHLRLLVVVGVAAVSAGCGARSSLGWGEGGSPGTTTTGSSVSSSSVATSASSTSTGPCIEGTKQLCGSNVGACKQGHETCHDGVFGPCEGAIGPKPEACNGIDENCNGTINDCDPGSGTCSPTLVVTGSVPSSPNCYDFPVMKGSHGSITYTCPGDGGVVTATLDGVSFTGSVTNGDVTLDGIATISPPKTPDGCTWQIHHQITGSIHSGQLDYSYSEMVISYPPLALCWSPCTETGTVHITWPMGG